MANQSRARSQRDPLDDQTSDRHLLVTVGRLVRGTRREIGWTQVRLGAEAGVSQPMVSLIEGACLPDLTFSTAARLLGALGVDLCIVTQEPLLGDRRRQRDAAHARCVAYVRARLERAGWLTASEVEIGRGRARRWIDVLAFHPVERALLVIEVKTVIDDLGQIERVLSTYERGAWQAAHELGWHPRLVVGCLIALATAAVDARVLANRTAFDLGFPVRSAEFADVISSPASPAAGRGRALALIDPLSRRATWLRASRLDGRRSPAPYTDYADFVQHLGTGQPPSMTLVHRIRPLHAWSVGDLSRVPLLHACSPSRR